METMMNVFRLRLSSAVFIAGTYIVVGAAWILFSDHVVSWLARDRTALEHLQTLKGWFFTAVTGSLLYLLLRRHHGVLASRERALKEKERTLSTLLGNLPGMAYRCRNDRRWTMEFVSQGALDLTGFAPEDLIQNRSVAYVDLIEETYRTPLWNQIQEALARHGSFQFVYRITTRDGKQKWVWEQGTGVPSESAEPEALEGFVTDITELKRLQEESRHRQKLEAIGRLAGSVAHDFNNLLTVIGGYSDLVSSHLKGRGLPLREVEEIQATVKRAGHLTDQLLAFSRRQTMQRENLDFNRVLSDMTSLLQHVAGKGVALRLDVPSGSSWVSGDRGQLEQVVMNLAVNAVDAMPAGGELRLAVSRADVGEEEAARRGMRPGLYVRLAATDTGCGMPPEVLDRVFEPFFTTKEKGKGTGLGLSTVYGIVMRSGGHVGVRSVLGAGTTFTIHYPLLETDKAVPSPHLS